MFNLLIFIIKYKKLSNDVSIKKTRMFKHDHKKIITIMKMRCQKHVRKLIENCINAVETYKILEKNFIFKNADIVNDAFHKLFNIRLKNYFSIDAYINKFRNTIDELKIFSFKMILNDNLLIYWFHINLNFNYDQYQKNYIQIHEIFNDNDEIKQFFSEIMTRFLNIMRNFTNNIIINNITSVTIASIILNNVQNETISNSNSRIIIKLIQHCIYYNKDYHIEKWCEIKFFHLKRERKKRKERKQKNFKRRRNNKSKNNDNKENNNKSKNDDHENVNAIFVMFINVAVTKLIENSIYFFFFKEHKVYAMIVFNLSNVYNVFSLIDWKIFNWIFDFEANVHNIHIRFVFIKLKKFNKFYIIRDINDFCEVFAINIVSIFYNDVNDRINLILKNVFYIFECVINLIFQKQLNDVDYFMQIYKRVVDLKINDIQIKKRNKNLYIFNVWNEQPTTLAAINEKIEKKWHKQIKHLNKFNVRRLQQMFTNMNLIKIFSKKNACSICAEIRMKTKIHKNFIRSNRYVNELIHNDLTEFFKSNVYEVKYYINFLNDWFKRFEIFFLNRKSDAFKIFENYKKIHEYEKCRIRRLRNDDENEYNNHVFHERLFEKNIQWKFIIFNNSQQNDASERFN